MPRATRARRRLGSAQSDIDTPVGRRRCGAAKVELWWSRVANNPPSVNWSDEQP